jgi:NitT/TauT family transport system permease protein
MAAIDAPRVARTADGTSGRSLWLQRTVGLLLGVLGIVIAIFIWWAIVRYYNISQLELPSPGKTWEALSRGLRRSPSDPRSLIYQAEPTLKAALIGFVLASITGFLLGFMLFEWKFAGQLLWPLVIAFQALPKVALAPVLVIWFGTGQNAKIILVVIVSFFPVFINTMVGLESLHRNEEEMLHSFGANRWQVLRYGQLPAALPVIFAGLESALLLSLVAIVVGEFVAGTRGLGFLINQSQYNLDMPAVFSILVVFAVVGVVLLEIMVWLERRIVFWRRPRRGIIAFIDGASEGR